MRIIVYLLAPLICIAAAPASARSARPHVHYRAAPQPVFREAAPVAPAPSRESSLPSGAVTSNGCLSQGPADTNPCDPWYFKRVNPLIGGSYGD